MEDSLALCASAFVRNKGKNVFAENDILMGLSMDLRWMSYSDSKIFLSAMISQGIFEKSGDMYRAAQSIIDADVPVAYKPSKALIEDVKASKGKAPAQPAPAEKPVENVPAPESDVPEDMMPALMRIAVENGIDRREFMMRCNPIQRKLGVFIEVAALYVLRDAGIDITGLADRVYASVKLK